MISEEQQILQNIHLQDDHKDRLTASCRLYNKTHCDLLVLLEGFEKNPEEQLAQVKPRIIARQSPLIVQVRPEVMLDHESSRKLAEFIMELDAQSPIRRPKVFPTKCGLVLDPKYFTKDLKTALEQLGEVLENSVDSELVGQMCRALQATFDSVFSSKVQIGSVRRRSPDTVYDDYHTAMIEMEGGGYTTAILLSIPNILLVPVVERMLGPDAIKENPEITMSVPCEVINILAGLGRASLNDSGYELHPATFPRLVTPEMQGMLRTNEKAVGIELDFDSEIGKMVFETRFYR